MACHLEPLQKCPKSKLHWTKWQKSIFHHFLKWIDICFISSLEEDDVIIVPRYTVWLKKKKKRTNITESQPIFGLPQFECNCLIYNCESDTVVTFRGSLCTTHSSESNCTEHEQGVSQHNTAQHCKDTNNCVSCQIEDAQHFSILNLLALSLTALESHSRRWCCWFLLAGW